MSNCDSQGRKERNSHEASSVGAMLVGIANIVVTASINIKAVVIIDAVYTLLCSSVASRGFTWAVVIIQAFNTDVLSVRAGITSRDSIAVIIRVADVAIRSRCRFLTVRQDAREISRALSVFELSTSPLGNRAVSISVTFYATSSLKSTTRSAGIFTLVISGTEVNADSAQRVAVRVDVVGGRRSIVVVAACSTIEKSAVRAKSVFVTVEESSSSITITV